MQHPLRQVTLSSGTLLKRSEKDELGASLGAVTGDSHSASSSPAVCFQIVSTPRFVGNCRMSAGDAVSRCSCCGRLPLWLFTVSGMAACNRVDPDM